MGKGRKRQQNEKKAAKRENEIANGIGKKNERKKEKREIVQPVEDRKKF
jgi:hypothetical protein